MQTAVIVMYSSWDTFGSTSTSPHRVFVGERALERAQEWVCTHSSGTHENWDIVEDVPAE